MHLRGLEVGERWRDLADTYASNDEAGFYVFNDLHAMMAYAATGRPADADRLLTEVERQSTAHGTNAHMTRAVGLAAVGAVHAFGRSAYARAADLLLPGPTRPYPRTEPAPVAGRASTDL